jgi:hypothetical protein
MSSCLQDIQSPILGLPSDCAVSMEYDAETTTLIRPAKASDLAQLSLLDRTLMLPQRERRQEQICLQEGGLYRMTSELLTPEQPIEYPPQTIGAWLKPNYHRFENLNGNVTFYNAQGEAIDADWVPADASAALEVVQLFAALRELPPLTDAEFAAGLDTLVAYGLPPLTTHGSQLATSRTVHPDGSYSISVIDKTARMAIGQLNFEASGELSTLHLLKVSGQAPNVQLERMVRVFFFDAIESEVRMKAEQITVFKSFSLSYH